MNTKLMTSVMHDLSKFADDMRRSALDTAAQGQVGSHGRIYEYEFSLKHVHEVPTRSFRPKLPTFVKPNGASCELVLSADYTFTLSRDVKIMNTSAFAGYKRRLEALLRCDERFDDLCNVSLISSIICTGSAASVYSEEIIHCTQDLRGTGPAFTYVKVSHNNAFVLGRVAAITAIQTSHETSHYLDLEILKVTTPNSYRYVPWVAYEWDWDTEADLTKIATFPVEAVIDFVRMDPCMNTSASAMSSNRGDRFVYLSREFYERRDTHCPRDAYNGINLVNANAAKRWIERNVALGPMIPRIRFPTQSEILEMKDPMGPAN
jgi:hypothetical protein